MAVASPRTIFGIRPEERGLVAWSASVLALATAAAAMVAAGADALFLIHVGPSYLGLAVAASSALLAVVLGGVGAIADRVDRPRLLGGLSLLAAGFLAVMAATFAAAPTAVAVIAMIVGKQLAAAVDLAFWVVIAERLDARQATRLVPVIAAAGGIGTVVGAGLVVVIADRVGPVGCLVGAAALLLGAAALASRTTSLARVGASIGAVGGAWRVVGRAWADGARAVSRHPLAGRLAIVVALGGAFASLAYFALGAAAAASHDSPGELAGFLGVVRGGTQVAALAVQLLVTPFLLARFGTGRTLIIAPACAAMAAAGLVIEPLLIVAVIAQAQARVLDGAVETPAEKLAQSLLPVEVRGRVAGFLDGAAKRSGALIGGLIAAVLVAWPRPLFAVTVAVALAWLYVAWRLSRRLPALAVSAAVDRAGDDDAVDAKAIGLILRELDGPRPERAAEVLGRLHERGRIDALPALVRAADHVVAQAAGVTSISYRGPKSGLASPAIGTIDTTPELDAILSAAVRCAALGGTLAPGDDVLVRLVERSMASPRIGPRTRDLVVRLAGLAGVDGAALRAAAAAAIASPNDASGRDSADAAADDARAASQGAALAIAVDVAERRAARDPAGALDLATDATRDDDAAVRACAVREVAIELEHRMAAIPSASPAPNAVVSDALVAARALTRAVRRGRGDPPGHAAGLAALAALCDRVRGTTPDATTRAELALLRADLLELVREWIGAEDAAPGSARRDPVELAAVVRLGGALLDGADAVDVADVRLLVGELGDRDDDVRSAAEEAVARVGGLAVGELLTAVAYGKRAARDHAARLLAALPVTRFELDRMIERELDALDRTCVHAGALVGIGGGLLARRLDERAREIAHTVMLLVAARERSRALPLAARTWRHAIGGHARARALAIIDAALPRDLTGRLIESVDELPTSERARRVAARVLSDLDRDVAIRAELAGGDRLARALVLDGLGAAGRAAHRDAIGAAARAAAAADRSSPMALLRRLAGGDDVDDEVEDDVPSRVETLIVLGKLPLFAQLTTRHLADVAERARWQTVSEGAVVIAAGETIDALWIVADGELGDGTTTWGRDQSIDELAVVAPIKQSSEIRATRPTRLVRLDRVDFEELLDDVPGLGPAVCRVLGERARTR
jgi:hypothetical protein